MPRGPALRSAGGRAALATDNDIPGRRPLLAHLGQRGAVEEAFGHVEQHGLLLLEVPVGDLQEFADQRLQRGDLVFLSRGLEETADPAVFGAHHRKRPHLAEVRLETREQQILLLAVMTPVGISPDEIHDLAKQLFGSNQMGLTMLGPVKEKKVFEEILYP